MTTTVRVNADLIDRLRIEAARFPELGITSDRQLADAALTHYIGVLRSGGGGGDERARSREIAALLRKVADDLEGK